MARKLPVRLARSLSDQIGMINDALDELGRPDDLGILFDCEEADFEEWEILHDSAHQFALGFIAAVALMQGVAPETFLKTPKKRRKTGVPKKAQKKGERKTDGPGATVIQLHRGGKP